MNTHIIVFEGGKYEDPGIQAKNQSYGSVLLYLPGRKTEVGIKKRFLLYYESKNPELRSQNPLEKQECKCFPFILEPDY